MSRTHSIVWAAALLATVTTACSDSTGPQADPTAPHALALSVPVTSCGMVLTSPGKYHLTENLTGCDSPITIAAHNVDLRLNGHSIVGNDGPESVGITTDRNRRDVRVLGPGSISGFEFGVGIEGRNASINNLTITGVDIGIFLNSSGETRSRIKGNSITAIVGIVAYGSSEVLSNTVVISGGLGAIAVDGANSLVSNNDIVTDGDGLKVGGAGTIVKNNQVIATGAQLGLVALGDTCVGLTFTDNLASSGTECIPFDVPVHACGTTIVSSRAHVLIDDLSCGGNGITVDADDVVLRLDGHTISGSGNYGIEVLSTSSGTSIRGPGIVSGFTNAIQIAGPNTEVKRVSVTGGGNAGIYFAPGADGGIAYRNSLSGTRYAGLSFAANNGLARENTVSGFQNGLFYWPASTNHIVRGNTVTGASDRGVYFDASGSKIFLNTFTGAANTDFVQEQGCGANIVRDNNVIGTATGVCGP